MRRRLSKRAIAAALKISPPAFKRYEKRGCPTWSIEAARAWQEQNVDPAQRFWRDQRLVSEGRVEELLAEIERTGDQVEQDLAAELEQQLRNLMQALPLAVYERVKIPVLVWRRLIGDEALAYIKSFEPAVGEEPEPEPAANEDPYLILFELATGLARIKP